MCDNAPNKNVPKIFCTKYDVPKYINVGAVAGATIIFDANIRIKIPTLAYK